MLFTNERQLNVPCANTLCPYQGDSRFEAHCDSELDSGDPAHSTCKLYFPIEQPPAELVEARQQFGEAPAQQANGETISLCIGCVKENCSHRSEIKCCPVTVCAMRQAK